LIQRRVGRPGAAQCQIEQFADRYAEHQRYCDIKRLAVGLRVLRVGCHINSYKVCDSAGIEAQGYSVL
jgi:hypothetical protein